MKEEILKNKNIVIGVCGGIACYKACEVVSKLKHLGANIFVIMTKNATEFVAPLTFETLSKHKVTVDMFENKQNVEVEHISLAKVADLFLIVPATANIIGKVANGIADDMLSTTIMATRSPVIFAPAMNDNMYTNKIVNFNMERLKSFGYQFIDAKYGNLACGYQGIGKLQDVDKIVDYVINVLEK